MQNPPVIVQTRGESSVVVTFVSIRPAQRDVQKRQNREQATPNEGHTQLVRYNAKHDESGIE